MLAPFEVGQSMAIKRFRKPKAVSSPGSLYGSPRKGGGRTDDVGSVKAALPIVGIGMSAGGLEVATAFLNATPSDSGMAFIIVQHLEPTRPSLIAELLGRETTMPVVQIEDGMKVEPNRVHVIVPAKTLTINEGVLHLRNPEEPRAQRHPIDRFFTSLANDQGEKAIAIVLSGAGSNGTAGIQDIRQSGGLCIAQDPSTARFDSMPRHAIESGAIDYVLAPDEMPEALRRYAESSYYDRSRPDAIDGKSDSELDDVLGLLRARAGHDFRPYKKNTLARRTHRRMTLAGMERFDDYLALLKTKPAEVSALARDMTINVTAFFRDAEAWDALDREVIAPLVEKADARQSIRAWVPACSTGEEAYTIAMLLAERGEAFGKKLKVKIFATDLTDDNLSAARKGKFPASMVESLSSERLARFFEKGDDDSYRVTPALRETVIFAPQNLLEDPPYSNMDLVSCRNLLIYLEPAAQEKVLSRAHFALREGGYLFLGSAETIGQRDHLFTTVSKRWRIYRRTGRARSGSNPQSWSSREHASGQPAASNYADVASRSLAEFFAPASVLIDRNYRALHFHGATDDYLTQPKGAPTHDLLTLARQGLRLGIRRAVQMAAESAKAATVRAAGARSAPAERVSITASPIEDGLVLVSFVKPRDAPRTNPSVANQDGRFDRDHEDELTIAHEELQRTVEQFETTTEELKAANEEITSVNEELQCTNEELESSKEELQSLNEELATVNSQLERKLVELEHAGDDLRNLLSGSGVATIFLDERLRIKWFTPAMQSLFDIIESDIGRPIGNFTQKFKNGRLQERATAAIERLVSAEDEVVADDDRIFLLRVTPYRTRDNRIVGAVATFTDISALKAIQKQIVAARDYAEAIIETIRDPLLVITADLRVASARAGSERTESLRDSRIG